MTRKTPVPDRRQKPTNGEAWRRIFRQANKDLDNGPYDFHRQKSRHGRNNEG